MAVKSVTVYTERVETEEQLHLDMRKAKKVAERHAGFTLAGERSEWWIDADDGLYYAEQTFGRRKNASEKGV